MQCVIRTHGEEVVVDRVVGRAVVRVGRTFAVVVRNYQIVVDAAVGRDDAGAAVAESGDVRHAVPAVPRAAAQQTQSRLCEAESCLKCR